MRKLLVVLVAVLATSLSSPAFAQTLVKDVRAAIAKNDMVGADALVRTYRAQSGTTPESLAAMSWMARGALAAGDRQTANRVARDTERLTLDALKTKTLADSNLAIALGASLEVQSRVMSDGGQRASAVKFLQTQIARYRNTPIHARLTKNLNLVSLEGQPAPKLTAREFLGAPMPDMKGHATVLFFWAHWCPDCKAQAPILGELEREYREAGLLVIGPTRHYGYVAGGAEAPPARELAYIDQVRQQYYSVLPRMAVPVSDEDALDYGMDATPTIVLLDRAGIVRMFHPGQMTRTELEPKIRELLGLPPTS